MRRLPARATRAAIFTSYLSSSIAAITRSRIASPTRLLPLMTRDTLVGDTLATRATSYKVLPAWFEVSLSVIAGARPGGWRKNVGAGLLAAGAPTVDNRETLCCIAALPYSGPDAH